MDGVVDFDIAEFRALYPNIKATDAQLEMYFFQACMLLDNTKTSCVKNLTERKLLLYLLVAHIATLQGRIDGGNDSVGRVSSATEGSVSVSFDYGQTTLSDKWYTQTPYGAQYWALTSKYRSFLYVAANYPMPVRR